MIEDEQLFESELSAQTEPAQGPVLEGAHLPVWKVAVLALSALQIGPAIALAAGSVTEFVGLNAWVTFVIAVAAIICVAIAVSSCARRYVVTGSLMSYVFHTLGPRARGVTAAALVLGYMVMAGTITATAVVFSTSALVDLGFPRAADGLIQCLSAIVISAFASACAYRGVDASVRIATTFSFVCLPFVVCITVMAAWHGRGDFSSQFHYLGLPPERLIQGTMAAFANFVCFDGLTALAAETANPRKNVPKILAWSLGITIVCVVSACLVQAPLLVANQQQIAHGASPIAVLAGLAALDYLKVPVDLLLAPAVIASVVAFYNYGARVLATAAVEGLLPRAIGSVHVKHHSPHRAVITLGFAGALLPVAMQFISATPPLLGAVYLGNLLCYFWFVPYVLVCVGAARASFVSVERDWMTLLGSSLGAFFIMALLIATLWYPLPGIVGHWPIVALSSIALLSLIYLVTGRLEGRVKP